MISFPIEADYPWAIQVFDRDLKLVDIELRLTLDAAEKAVSSYEEEGLICCIIPTRSPSVLPFLRSIGS